MSSDVLKSACIFLANDNYNTLINIKTLLEDSGYRNIDTFANGNELLFGLQNRKPDIIISDICMPQVDGFQLLREIKSNADPQVGRIPVILCSATFNDFETRKLANELGAEAFFTIPFNARDFLAALEKSLAQKIAPEISKSHSGGGEAEIIKLAILEDDLFSSRFLLHALKDLKYELHTAETIAEFYQLFNTVNPQICILDYNLPDGDGIDVLKNVKKIRQETKVIMMTSITNERMIDDFIKEGADNFINKPINVRNLIAAIKNAVESLAASKPGGVENALGNGIFSRDFSADYSDYFINAPLALAIIDDGLNCLRHNFEFDVYFKNNAANPRAIDEGGAINISQLLAYEEAEKLKTVLNEMKRKDAKTKYRFNFSAQGNGDGQQASKNSILIKSASNSDIIKNNYIFYIAITNCGGF